MQEHVARLEVKVAAGTEFFAFQIHVRPITLSCLVGFENFLTEMISTTRRCVACKNHVAGHSRHFKFVHSCPTLNFIPKIGGI